MEGLTQLLLFFTSYNLNLTLNEDFSIFLPHTSLCLLDPAKHSAKTLGKQIALLGLPISGNGTEIDALGGGGQERRSRGPELIHAGEK